MDGIPSRAGLLDRERELALARRLLDDVPRRGALLVLEGEPGIGKTRMLEELRALADDAGLLTLPARGSQLEREYAFGVASQLLEPTLARATDADREELLHGPARLALTALDGDGAPATGPSPPSGADPAFPVLHGLYWLIANLCARRPLLLAVDDAQWADDASLRFLAFLAPRLAELPALLALTARTGDAFDVAALFPRPSEEHRAYSLRLGPLSPEATASLVRRRLADADEEFCRACHESTRGNPFLLTELVPEVVASGLEPTAAAAGEVARLAPEGVSRSILLRLEALPEGAAGLARSVAILGDGAAPALAATLAELAFDRAAAAADALVAADLLTAGPSLAFKHPLIRAAVESSMPPAERARQHARAAALLIERAAAPEQVAVQLLGAWPDSHPAAATTLRLAGGRTLERGAAPTAVVYLRRALAEAMPPGDRVALLGDLAQAELLAGDARAAAEHIEEALAATSDPAQRAPLTVALARARLLLGEPGGVAAMIEQAIEQAAGVDPGLAFRLEAALMETVALLESAVDEPPFPWIRRRIDRSRRSFASAEPAAARVVQVIEAVVDAAIGESTSSAVAASLLDAMDGDAMLRQAGCESIVYWSAVYVLIRAESFGPARSACEAGLADARQRGSAMGFVLGSAMQSQIALRTGDVVAAVAAGESSAEAAEAYGFAAGMPLAPAFLVDALVEHGEHPRAREVVERSGLSGVLPRASIYWNVLEARGRLRLVEGDRAGGVEDLLALWSELRRPGHRGSFYLFPAGLAGPALAQMGDRAGAVTVVEEELELARRWGAPGQIGVDLRALGIVTAGEQGHALLRESVEVLAASDRRLEHARSLIDLGAALRRSGHRSEARRHLKDGHELAMACGAHPLAELAGQELAATGARPRNVARTGLDDLTPSERRVAQMAADGLSNPEIAAALFVTTKTIETHLSHVYRKLGITSRWKLPAALAGASLAGHLRAPSMDGRPRPAARPRTPHR